MNLKQQMRVRLAESPLWLRWQRLQPRERLSLTLLGAFLLVVLPNIRSGIGAAFILAFIVSFNNVPVSLFLTGPGVTTLPISIDSPM